MKFYVSFGQGHTHSINGITLDKDCIVELERASRKEAHEDAMEMFNAQFFTVYIELPDMSFFPRGIIKL